MLSIDVLTTLAELESIEVEWRDLLDRCSRASPFQRPEWVLTWCRHFDCRNVWTPVIRSEERLVAVAPWLIYSNGSRRLLAFLAGGVSDYHDVLVDPAFADAAFAKLFELLYESRGTWDECDFEQLGAWSTLRAQPVPSAFVDSHHEEDPCPVLELPSFPVPLSAVVPSKQLARLAKYRRRAERQGTLALREGNYDDLAHLFRLHQARWQQKGLPGVLGENRLQTFHQDVVRRIGFEHARMYCLDFDGEPIAAIYALITRSVLHCYLQGFDPVFGSLSPGLLVVGGVLERAHESGFTAVDFLRGEEPYKTMWGARGAPNTRRRLRLRSS